MFIPKAKSPCCIPGCGRPRWSRGRCGRHGQELKLADPAEWMRIAQLSNDQQEHLFYLTAHQLPLPKWEYQGDEDYLARLCERRQRYLDTHDVPALLSWEDLDDLIAKEGMENDNEPRLREA